MNHRREGTFVLMQFSTTSLAVRQQSYSRASPVSCTEPGQTITKIAHFKGIAKYASNILIIA